MSEQAQLSVMPEEVFVEQLESGLLVPLDSLNIRLDDCAEHRPPSPATRQQRLEVNGTEATGRIFGVASGYAAIIAITYAAQSSERGYYDLVDQYGEGILANLATDIQQRALRLEEKVVIHQHSDTTSEGNQLNMAYGHDHPDPLGCKFATFAGAVLNNSARPETLTESTEVASMAGIDLPIKEVSEGAKRVSSKLPDDYSVTRSSLHDAVHVDKVPFAVHEDVPIVISESKVVYDLAGVASDAFAHLRQGNPNFHHTPSLADILAKLFPEIKLDKDLIRAAALLLGPATRRTLAAPNTQSLEAVIIPDDYKRNFSLAA